MALITPVLALVEPRLAQDAIPTDRRLADIAGIVFVASNHHPAVAGHILGTLEAEARAIRRPYRLTRHPKRPFIISIRAFYVLRGLPQIPQSDITVAYQVERFILQRTSNQRELGKSALNFSASLYNFAHWRSPTLQRLRGQMCRSGQRPFYLLALYFDADTFPLGLPLAQFQRCAFHQQVAEAEKVLL